MYSYCYSFTWMRYLKLHPCIIHKIILWQRILCQNASKFGFRIWASQCMKMASHCNSNASIHAIHNNPYTRLSDRSCHLKVSLLGCREFYYIQMEKYARQGISEGLKNQDDLIVSTDTEIYRVLSLHYNRNNQIEVRLLC